MIFLGIIYINPSYVQIAASFIRIGIAVILIIRFNPFIKHDFKKFDGELIFTAAIILLVNEFINKYIIANYDDLSRGFKKIITAK
jgi:hypothetical protein